MSCGSVRSPYCGADVCLCMLQDDIVIAYEPVWAARKASDTQEINDVFWNPYPSGSKYTMFNDSGPKYHSGYDFWSQRP